MTAAPLYSDAKAAACTAHRWLRSHWLSVNMGVSSSTRHTSAEEGWQQEAGDATVQKA